MRGVGWVLVVTLSTALAHAEPPSAALECTGPSVELARPLAARQSWARAVGDANRRLSDLRDVDACTRITLEEAPAGARMRVSTADGRSVVRELASPNEVEATAVAVLVLPPRAEDESTPGPEPTRATPPKAVVPVAAAAGERSAGRSGAAAAGVATRSSLELAAGAAGRASGYLRGAGGAALLDWDVASWLLGVGAHGEGLWASGSAGDARLTRQLSFAASPVFGRRLLGGTVVLDVAVEAPVLAVRSSSWLREVPSATPAGAAPDEPELEPDSDDPVPMATDAGSARVETSATELDLRAGAFVRFAVPLSRSLRAFAALDVDRTLGVLAHSSGAPESPAWSSGIVVGLLGGPL